jgi:hypothetical protein
LPDATRHCGAVATPVASCVQAPQVPPLRRRVFRFLLASTTKQSIPVPRRTHEGRRVVLPPTLCQAFQAVPSNCRRQSALLVPVAKQSSARPEAAGTQEGRATTAPPRSTHAPQAVPL